MVPASDSHPITVSTSSAGRLEGTLDQAVSKILERAVLERKRGILVTQEASGRFTAALHDEAPFGTTKARRSWHV